MYSYLSASTLFFALFNLFFVCLYRTENVTFEYTVTPKINGVTRVPRTSIKYDDKEAFIDADIDLLVESPEEYAKRTNRHIVC